MTQKRRLPIMAGNWKMNLDHHQATHIVQKLSWTLADADHDFVTWFCFAGDDCLQLGHDGGRTD